jgi:hypothetical protein
MDAEATLTLVALVTVPLLAIWALHDSTKAGEGASAEATGLRLYRAGSVPEAHLLCGMLQAEGIHALVKNELLAGAIGELPMMSTLPEVWLVHASDEPMARRVLDGYRARASSKLGPDVACAACAAENPPNFELCWKCRKPLHDVLHKKLEP